MWSRGEKMEFIELQDYEIERIQLWLKSFDKEMCPWKPYWTCVRKQHICEYIVKQASWALFDDYHNNDCHDCPCTILGPKRVARIAQRLLRMQRGK